MTGEKYRAIKRVQEAMNNLSDVLVCEVVLENKKSQIGVMLGDLYIELAELELELDLTVDDIYAGQIETMELPTGA